MKATFVAASVYNNAGEKLEFTGSERVGVIFEECV